MRFTIRELLPVTVIAALGCSQQPPPVQLNPHFDTQAQEVDRRSSVANQLLAEQEASVKRAGELLTTQEAQLQRMGKLLDKLEEQARRKDVILDAEEKQLGIKK